MGILGRIQNMFNLFDGLLAQFDSKDTSHRCWYIMDISSKAIFSSKYEFILYNKDQLRAYRYKIIKAKRCPGILAGIIHKNGQEALDNWLKAHPNWHEEFGNEKVIKLIKGQP